MSAQREAMRAVTLDRFGGPEVLRHGYRPIPQVGPREVLIEVAYAGVGAWDPDEREGTIAELTGEVPDFPFTPGGDGSGRVVAVGADVDRFTIGDLVYGVGGGFYAEYVSRDADAVAHLPARLDLVQAGAMPIAALTALHGLSEALEVTPGQAVAVNGASGDVGHLAVQLAKLLGARVLAIASGSDGVQLALDLGADAAVDGRTQDVASAAHDFAPEGLDAVLSFAGGDGQRLAVQALREGGRVAFPLGVQPEPAPRAGIAVRPFDLTTDEAASTRRKMSALNALIETGPFVVRISRLFPLEQAVAAQESLRVHRLGKIVLDASGGTEPKGEPAD